MPDPAVAQRFKCRPARVGQAARMQRYLWRYGPDSCRVTAQRSQGQTTRSTMILPYGRATVPENSHLTIDMPPSFPSGGSCAGASSAAATSFRYGRLRRAGWPKLHCLPISCIRHHDMGSRAERTGTATTFGGSIDSATAASSAGAREKCGWTPCSRLPYVALTKCCHGEHGGFGNNDCTRSPHQRLVEIFAVSCAINDMEKRHGPFLSGKITKA